LTVEAGYGQHRESPSKSRFLRWSYQDAADWVETTDRKRLLRTAGFVAALVPLSLLDEEVSEAAMDWNRGLFGDFLHITNETGSLTAPLIPTGIFLVSLATDDAKFQDAAFTSLQAIIYTNVISFTVKSFIGRARPEDGKGVHHFARSLNWMRRFLQDTPRRRSRSSCPGPFTTRTWLPTGYWSSGEGPPWRGCSGRSTG